MLGQNLGTMHVHDTDPLGLEATQPHLLLGEESINVISFPQQKQRITQRIGTKYWVPRKDRTWKHLLHMPQYSRKRGGLLSWLTERLKQAVQQSQCSPRWLLQSHKCIDPYLLSPPIGAAWLFPQSLNYTNAHSCNMGSGSVRVHRNDLPVSPFNAASLLLIMEWEKAPSTITFHTTISSVTSQDQSVCCRVKSWAGRRLPCILLLYNRGALYCFCNWIRILDYLTYSLKDQILKILTS